MRPTDPSAATYGLPGSMRIPIAARSLEAIERFVGPIRGTYGRVHDQVGAVLIDTSERPEIDKARLWTDSRRAELEVRLFPLHQVWVHVDYNRYRAAYLRLGMSPIPGGEFLDHVQNRRAIRLRDYSHPYVRLCLVSRRVNTSAGVNSGAEGMERAHLETAKTGNAAAIRAIELAKRQEVVYADPLDLTKMLNIAPGTVTLDGVRDTQSLFYP